jgi:transketolase
VSVSALDANAGFCLVDCVHVDFQRVVRYGIGAVRLTALSHFRVLFIMTHDSIGLGEVGCLRTLCLLQQPRYLIFI